MANRNYHASVGRSAENVAKIKAKSAWRMRVALVAAAVLSRARRPAFAATAVAAIGIVATIFTGLYPRVLVSRPTFANSLTISNAAAGHYGLVVITIAAAIFTPIVLLYQGWTYYVFRQRLGGKPPASPVAVVAEAKRTTASRSG